MPFSRCFSLLEGEKDAVFDGCLRLAWFQHETTNKQPPVAISACARSSLPPHSMRHTYWGRGSLPCHYSQTSLSCISHAILYNKSTSSSSSRLTILENKTERFLFSLSLSPSPFLSRSLLVCPSFIYFG